MSDENDTYAPAAYREHQEGHGSRDAHEHQHTGIVRDPLVSRFLSVQEENYDPRETTNPGEMPGTANRLDETEEITSIAATETGREALENGDTATLNHLKGDTKQRADISGIKAIQQLDEIITDPAPVLVILGDMGSGKTDFGGLVGQRAKHLLGVEQVASNNPSLQEVDDWTDQDGEERDGFVPDLPTLEEWLRQDGDPLENEQSKKLFLGDEFSSVGSGSGKDGYMVRTKMGPLVFKIRKWGAMLIYIAHDPSSIHPLLWRVGYVLKKEDLKKAVVADRVKNGEVKDERFKIEGIPPTDWRYDTNDPSVWSWTAGGDDEDSEPEEIAFDVAVWTVRECKQNGLTHRDTAEYVPFSKSWVGDRWKEIQEGEHEAAMDRVEAITA